MKGNTAYFPPLGLLEDDDVIIDLGYGLTNTLEELSSVKSRVDTLDEGFAILGTSITQTAEEIALRATKEEFNALGSIVEDHQASITINAEQIALRVTTDTFNELGNVVETQAASITLQSDEIALKVSQDDFDSLGNIVESQGSAITLQAGEIDLRVTKTEFDVLGGIVEDQSAAITIQADEIALKVTQTDFNTLEGTVESHSSALIVQAEEITAKVSQTDFNTLSGTVEQSTAELIIQATNIALKVSQEDFNNLGVEVSDHTAAITLQSEEIAARVTATTFNELKGTVESQTAELVVHSDSIALKATKTEVSDLGEIVDSHTAEFLVQADMIESKVSGDVYATDLTATKGLIADSVSHTDVVKSSLETKITQTQTDISLKASKEDFNAMGERVSTAEASLVIQAGLIESTVTMDDFQTQISQTQEEIALKASSGDLNTLAGRVASTEAEIIINSSEIALKVSSSDYNIGMSNLSGSIQDNIALVNNIKDELQSQIDKEITSWFFAYEPSNVLAPENTWGTDAIRAVHLGDLFYDTSSGYAYRYMKAGNIYSWGLIKDSDITLALSKASKAQDTADNKRRVFGGKPFTPYDIGDMWVINNNDLWAEANGAMWTDDGIDFWTEGSAGSIMTCIIARTSGQYVPGDFMKASNYTDDTTANIASTKADVANLAAETAQRDALIANNAIADIASDDKFTPVEKSSIKKEMASIALESITILAQADNYGVTTEKVAYSASYTSLNTYITPLITSLTTTEDIIGSTFRSKFSTYYDKRTILLKRVSDIAKSNIDTAQSSANMAQSSADSAQHSADSASLQAQDAMDLLSDISNDGKLTPSEKGSLKSEYDQIVTEKPHILEQVGVYSVSIGVSDYSNSYNALCSLVNPLLASLTTTSDVDGIVLRDTFNSYYSNRGVLLTAIATKAKQLSSDAQAAANAADARAAQAGVNADNASVAAATAQASANLANTAISDIASDDKLSPSEKQSIKKEYNIIVSEKPTLAAQADTYSIVTEKNDYTTVYDSLSSFISPLIADINSTSDIVGNTFRTYFKNYYDKRTLLLKKVSDVSKVLADAAKTAADNATSIGSAAAIAAGNAATIASGAATAASNAQTTATNAQTSASAALTSIADIAADDKLTPSEKMISKRDWDTIVAEKAGIDAQADLFAISRNSYDTNYTTLNAYLTSLLSNLTTTDNIVGTTFRDYFKNYYTDRTALLNAIAAKAKELADTAQGAADTAKDAAATANTLAGTANTKATTAIAAASTAQSAADTANNLLSDIASDSKFTPNEKGKVNVEWGIIQNEKDTIVAQGNTYGVATSAYVNSYNTLSSYITPLISNLTTTSDIVSSTFKTTFSDYYQAKVVLLNSVSTAAKAFVAQLRTDTDASFTAVNGQLILKASTVTTDALGVRLSSAETSITANASAITLKATKTDLDVLTGRVTSTESSLTIQSGLIASKVESTVYTSGIAGAKTYADSTAVLQASSAQSTAISTAATDASNKATAAQVAATNAAALDASTKASNAQSAAISSAAVDASSKATAAQSTAINSASADATAKANAALASANAYTDVASSLLQTSITQTSSSIALKASQADLNSIGDRVSASESTIAIHASSIDLKVSKDNIINSINVSTEGITINASHVNITGSLNLDGIFTGGLIRADKIDVDNLTAKNINSVVGSIANFTISEYSLRSLNGYSDITLDNGVGSHIRMNPFGFYHSNSSSGGTNVGLQLSVSGADDNRAINVSAGDVCIHSLARAPDGGNILTVVWDKTTHKLYTY